MKYLHEHTDFRDFINITAYKTNLSRFIIEKDYWVTYLLKNLAKSEFCNELVFKGGTCLSKAYNLIERFSEDVDLLMLEADKTLSKNQKEKRIIKLRNFINGLDNLVYDELSSKRSALYASLKYHFPTVNTIDGVVTKEIKVEPGYRGGIVPKIQKKYITSYVENIAHGKLAGYDTESFEINVLSLERIFVEKLFAIKDIFNQDEGRTLQNKTRHYYDIYKLVQTQEIRDLLRNKKELETIVGDINNIERTYFTQEENTWDNLINHKAIKPDGELFQYLKRGYQKDRDLYNKQIDFEDIISKINEI